MHNSLPSRIFNIATATSISLGSIFLLAAVGKAWNFDRFVTVCSYILKQIGMQNHTAGWAIAATIIALETFLGILYVLQVYNRQLIVLTISLFILFTYALYAFLSNPSAPACGCLGVLRVVLRYSENTHAGILRNIALIFAQGYLYLQTPSHTHGTATDQNRNQHTSKNGIPGSSGFTLVELLVVFVILSILVAILLPALGKTKRTSQRVMVMSTMNQVNTATSSYTTDFKDAYPYFLTPGDPYGPKKIRDFNVDLAYFTANAWTWTSLLAPDYIPATAVQHEGWPEKRDEYGWPDYIIRSPFHLSHTTCAAPAYWDDDAPPDDLHLLRATTTREVLFPSDKGIILHTGTERDEQTHELQRVYGRADGSTSTLTIGLTEYDVVSRPFGVIPWPVLATRHGLKANNP